MLPALCVRSTGKKFVGSGSVPALTRAVTVTALLVVGRYGVMALVFSSCAPKICIDAEEPAPVPGRIVMPPSMLPVLTSAPAAQEKENRRQAVVAVKTGLPINV